ncbi:MAG TPA: hypothetical protein DER05_05070 [Lutibacter sp.]|nr:hypothetical protein [Lutibacter sp.]
MKTQFKISGFYYEVLGFKFRKYLDIKKVNSNCKTPDLMVVLQNPGSSRPINGIDNSNEESDAIPDNTQSQIMQVMLNCGYNYCRVLNLSDLREPKSNVFFKKMVELDSKGIAHSIFDENRQDDFNQLWINNIAVIFGWGVNDLLKPLALKAMDACNVALPFGLQKLNCPWAFYHPLPPVYKKQLEWVEEISEQIRH